MSSRAFDFLVVGGGPAGSAFALLAARAGAAVALVERDDYARRRPGEHLAGRIRPLLDSLGVTKPDYGIVQSSVGILSLWSADRSPLLQPYVANGDRMAIATVRHRFDAMLSECAARAGARVMRSTSLDALARDGSGPWSVVLHDNEGMSATLSARAVVDASGRTAAVARRQGARRDTHGDLIAIVRWLELASPAERSASPLTVESCPLGWWSLSTLDEPVAVGTLYTSARLMKASGMAPEAFWRCALATTEHVQGVAATWEVRRTTLRVFPAAPSLTSRVVGVGWIAIGDAAIALDPLGGQGAAFALDTACCAFEAARVDPTWRALGDTYRDALTDKFARHLAGRAAVYAEAAEVLSEGFLSGVVGRAVVA